MCIRDRIEPLVRRICEVAGYSVEAHFPRLTYAEAMRSYGIDKPDRRIPPMHPVEDLAPELAANGLPLVAIHIPNTGAPSRKERDELKAFGQERGCLLYTSPIHFDTLLVFMWGRLAACGGLLTRLSIAPPIPRAPAHFG